MKLLINVGLIVYMLVKRYIWLKLLYLMVSLDL